MLTKRDIWLALIKAYLSKSTTELRRVSRSIYEYLYRKYKERLLENSSKKKRKQGKKKIIGKKDMRSLKKAIKKY